MLTITLTGEARADIETILRVGLMHGGCFIMRDIVVKKKERTYNGEEIKYNANYANKKNLLNRGLDFLD